MNHKGMRGFTLIELMIVVAIIGILVAIALPQYGDYVSRSRWSDNFQGVGALKQAIAECMQNNSQAALAAPCNAIGAGAGTLADLIGSGYLPVNYVAAAQFGTVSMVGGAIQIVGDARASNCTVTLTPLGSASHVSWDFANAVGCNRTKTGVAT